jgi:hypothetical protein
VVSEAVEESVGSSEEGGDFEVELMGQWTDGLGLKEKMCSLNDAFGLFRAPQGGQFNLAENFSVQQEQFSGRLHDAQRFQCELEREL